jgi:hypothetical protein
MLRLGSLECRVEVGTVGYTLSTGVKFITEADRSVTTFLLPDEY